MTKLIVIQKRPLVLLEVLIAFAIVALCILPLIYPHVAIVKSEIQFIDTVELDHTVNLLFADKLEKLYRQEIGWSEIESGKIMPIEMDMASLGAGARELPFRGTYQFVPEKRKISEEGNHSAYVFLLRFVFTPINTKNKPLTYDYRLMIEKGSPKQ